MQKTKRLNLSKGFTLVELLVVIAIIGTLATLLLLQLGTARAKARDVKRVADISQMRSAMEQYFDDNGKYVNSNTNANLKSALVTNKTYITQIPQDPLTPGCTDYTGIGCYGYAYTSTAASPVKFHLWVELETKNSAALSADADINSSAWSGAGKDASPASSEACISNDITSVIDCVYDVGQQ